MRQKCKQCGGRGKVRINLWAFLLMLLVWIAMKQGMQKFRKNKWKTLTIKIVSVFLLIIKI